MRFLSNSILWRLDTLGIFSAIFTRETTFVTSCLLSYAPNSFWKGIYSKRKEFASTGSKFFPFRVDPFSGRRQTILTELPPLIVCVMPLSREWTFPSSTQEESTENISTLPFMICSGSNRFQAN